MKVRLGPAIYLRLDRPLGSEFLSAVVDLVRKREHDREAAIKVAVTGPGIFQV